MNDDTAATNGGRLGGITFASLVVIYWVIRLPAGWQPQAQLGDGYALLLCTTQM